VIVPTRNRPDNLPGQLRLLQRASYPIVIADSSDPINAARISAMMPDCARLEAFAPELSLYDKLELVLRTIETPYVLVVSDRKITFPHAIEPLLDQLIAQEDYVSAMGYVVGFKVYPNAIDINRVIWFTPTIAEDDPLQRHYHLMRRYQSWAFCVFRTTSLLRAAVQARRAKGPIFQELLLMNALALQGKMSRQPHILSLQSEERSFHPPKRNDPFYWFIDDIGSFFEHYVTYRSALTDFMHDLGILPPPNRDLNQLIDMIHAVWLYRNFDDGVLNHAARLLLGDAVRPISGPELPDTRRRRSWRDIVRRGARRYVWRDEVLRAEPSDEIQISKEEINRVTDQLDVYFGE
jgi:glycosyltransferase domain-containing protein